MVLICNEMVTVHTACTCCTASGQFSDGAGIQPFAVRRLFNGLDALQFAAGWAVNCNNVNQITTNLSSTKYKKYVMLITV